LNLIRSISRIVAIAILCMLVAIVTLFLIPTSARKLEDFRAWKDKKQKLEETVDRVRRQGDTEQTANEMRAFVQMISAVGQLQTEPGRLRYVQAHASKNDLAQLVIRPGQIDTSDAFVESRLYLQLLGTYQSIGHFLADLENGPVPTRIASVTMSGTGATVHPISVELTLQILTRTENVDSF